MVTFSLGSKRNAMRPPVRVPPFTSSRVARSGYTESMKPGSSL